MEMVGGFAKETLVDLIEEKVQEKLDIEDFTIDISDVKIGITRTDRLLDPSVAFEARVFINIPISQIIKLGIDSIK